jgi:hypothetical protein
MISFFHLTDPKLENLVAQNSLEKNDITKIYLVVCRGPDQHQTSTSNPRHSHLCYSNALAFEFVEVVK